MRSVLGDVIDLCSRTTSCRGALIYLWDEPNEELVVQAATADFSFAVGVVRLRLGQGLTGWSAMTRQPGVIADHPALDPRFISIPELDDDVYQSCLTVPLIVSRFRSSPTAAVSWASSRCIPTAPPPSTTTSSGRCGPSPLSLRTLFESSSWTGR